MTFSHLVARAHWEQARQEREREQRAVAAAAAAAVIGNPRAGYVNDAHVHLPRVKAKYKVKKSSTCVVL